MSEKPQSLGTETRRFKPPDGEKASEVQNRGCERAGGVYTAAAQDANMEIRGSGWN